MLTILATLVGLGVLVALLSPGLRLLAGQWLSFQINKVFYAITNSAGAAFRGFPGWSRGILKGGLALTAATSLTIGIAAPTIDSHLSLTRNQVTAIAESWDLIVAAGEKTGTNPIFIAAIWGVENGMRTENPSNGQGIGGFYTKVVALKEYWFPPGETTRAERYTQFELIGSEVQRHCPENTAVDFEGYMQVGQSAMWDRADCWAAYNGIRGYQEGDMTSAGAVFNNLPGYPNLQGLQICLGDGCPEMGPMRNDGYETYYQKVSALIFAALAASDGVGVESVEFPELSIWDIPIRLVQNYRNSRMLTATSPPNGFQPTFGRAPYQVITSYSALPRPAAGTWGPQFAPLGGNWVATQYDHGSSYGASCIDCASLDSKKAPVFAPISGVVKLYYDGLGNSVILIENEEWLVILLHHRQALVQNGSWVTAGTQIAIQGSVGNSTGPHVHACYYSIGEGSYVQAWRYIPNWPGTN